MWMFNTTSISPSSLLVLISIDTYHGVQYEGFCSPQLLVSTLVYLQGLYAPFLESPEYSTGWTVHSSVLILGLWVRPRPHSRTVGVQNHSVGWSESTSDFRMTAVQLETVMIIISQVTPQSGSTEFFLNELMINIVLSLHVILVVFVCFCRHLWCWTKREQSTASVPSVPYSFWGLSIQSEV